MFHLNVDIHLCLISKCWVNYLKFRIPYINPPCQSIKKETVKEEHVEMEIYFLKLNLVKGFLNQYTLKGLVISNQKILQLTFTYLSFPAKVNYTWDSS